MQDINAGSPTALTAFEQHRRLLLGLAYRMTGSWSDAEDIVQDAWLRWQSVTHTNIESPRAFLSRTVTRLCLDALKSARSRREEYFGMWLPEPLPEADDYTGPGTGEMAHDLSMALMLALERLSPLERAAFLLHDVFDMSYSDVAQALGRSETGCRQLATRARRNVREARPRYRVDQQDGMRIAEAFLQASREGRVEPLRRLLAEDAVLHTDGGGKKLATAKPILGANKISRFFAGIAAKEGGKVQHAGVAYFNKMPGILAIEMDGLPRTISLEINEGKIIALYLVRNPDKLRHVSDRTFQHNHKSQVRNLPH